MRRIDIYAALEDNERAEYQRDYPEEAATMSRFAERFHEQGTQQGIRQGMQQGMRQGKHQGETLVLECQLRLKFGTLPETVQQRIEQANEQTLLTWSERVLTADRLDEVLHRG